MTFLLNVKLSHLDEELPIRAWLQREIPDYWDDSTIETVHVRFMDGKSFFFANVTLNDEDIALTFRLTFSAVMGHQKGRDEIMDHYIDELAKTIQEEIDAEISNDLRNLGV